jgi:hypothetical protein
MDTNKKPAPDGNLDTGYDTAFDSRNHSPIHAKLKALLIGLAAYDVALLSLLAVVLWRILP